MSPVFAAMGTLVVVDRIEGPFAVLEWSAEELTEVPVTVLPEGVEEGDRLVFVVRRSPHNVLARGPRWRSRGATSARARRASELRLSGEGEEDAGSE